MSAVKKIDYTTTCWSCAGSLMQNKGSYFQCQSCGATWNPVIKLGPPCIIEEEDKFGVIEHYHSVAIPERRERKVKKEKEVE